MQHKFCIYRISLIMFTSAALCTTLIGCGSPGYGTPTTNLNVSLSPGVGTVYMIPMPVWEKNGRAMLDDEEKMDTWRVGPSPASARPMVDKPYVFIAEHDDGFTDPVIKTVTKKDKTLKITY